MANLAGSGNNGRPDNGGGLGLGTPAAPVLPYATEGSPKRALTPPTVIMRERKAREDRRRREEEDRRQALELEEQRRIQEEEDQQRLQAENRRRAQEENARLEKESAAAGDRPPAGDRTNVRRGAGGDVDRSRRPGSDPTTDRRAADRGSGGNARANLPATAQPATYPSPNVRSERRSDNPRENEPIIQQPRTRTHRRSTVGTNEPRPVETRTATAPRTVSATARVPGSTEANPPQTRTGSKVAGTSSGQQQGRGQQPPSLEQPANIEDSAQTAQQRNSNKSSFPHAFERWEQLSAQWEGLTSFWIRRLQQSQEELDKGSLNQQLARQVTDLSAAGANLFHAVVELQRLRASSERKFQRWFFETRAEQERSREIQAKLEEQLRIEKNANMQSAADKIAKQNDREIKDAYAAKNTADVQVREMRRELAISKDEARRAWEELGRMVQDERDRTLSLKNGEPTLVGGVQVVPMSIGVSRQTSTNQRPANISNSSSRQRSDNEAGYTTYDATRSETDTDPFSQPGGTTTRGPQVRDDPALPQPHLYQTSNSSAAALQAARAVAATQQPIPSNGSTTRTTTTTTTNSGSGGGGGSGGTYLQYNNPAHSSRSTTQQTTPSSFYQQHEGTSLHPSSSSDPRRRPVSEGDDHSYVPSVEDTLSDDFELDSNGEIVRDPSGHPVIATSSHRNNNNNNRLSGSGGGGGGGGPGSEDSDEYNVSEQLEREQMYGLRYSAAGSGGGGGPGGSGIPGVEYGSGPTRDGFAGAGWEGVQRHHHPTRLSDVLEEDERSRTSPSRASERSRGVR